jgi:glyoxylase-like metal-dependent hydrolase (beta-lactamase superfamily II)
MKSLPMPPGWPGPLPKASPPEAMAAYRLPTGTYETRAAFAVEGGSFRDKRRFAATPVLVMHPKGDLVIDAGFGTHVAEHVAALPRYQRPLFTATETVKEQLEAGGYDRNRLVGVLLTHSHWDHVGGLDGLDVPIWITPSEEQFAYSPKNRDKVYRIVAPGHEVHEYEFPGPPYLGFPTSFDIFGDGSVVAVPVGGHTPGSVVIFVALPSDKRYAFIGDLTWQLDGIYRRVERPWLMRKLADHDPEQVRQGLLRVIALADLMQIVPAHDLKAYEGIPHLLGRLADASESTQAAGPTPSPGLPDA